MLKPREQNMKIRLAYKIKNIDIILFLDKLLFVNIFSVYSVAVVCVFFQR